MKYITICNYIRDKIMNGNWIYNDCLPSQRQLAEQFKVNRTTIIKCLDILESEGFVYKVKGSGVYVDDYLNPEAISTKWNEMMKWSTISRNNYLVQIINKVETDSSYIHISKGELGKELIPITKINKALEATNTNLQSTGLGYQNGYGDEVLREQISQRMNRLGINSTMKNVLITSGALHAIQMVLMGFLGQGSIIFVHENTYINSTNILKNTSHQKVMVNLDNINEFEKVINQYTAYQNKVVYINPTFSNPEGTTLDDSQRKKLIELCNKKNILILEDDIYRDIAFNQLTPLPLKAYDLFNDVIYIGSYSKSLAPGLRIGWIVASERVIDQLSDIRMQIDYGSSVISQKIVSHLLESEEYDHHLTELKVNLNENKEWVLKVLNEEFKDIAEWNQPSGGFFIWLKFKESINIKKLFFQLLKEEKILINPSSIYGKENNAIRLSYAFENLENINHALLKIKAKYIEIIKVSR